MEVTIIDIELHHVKKPLKKPFKTALQTVIEREGILIRAIDDEGVEGYGECVAFSTPWYTEETIAGCRFVLEQVLVPLLLNQTLKSPGQVQELFKSIKGNRMAKAALETAIWDLFAKKQGIPLWKYVGGINKPIPAGVVVAADEDKMALQVEAAVAKGYKRIKLKITPASNTSLLKGFVARFPDILFFADANGGFNEGSFSKLLRFDSIGFALIEQPFSEKEWQLHARAKKEMKTPICLDESIHSLEDVQRMIELEAGDVIVLKMGRLGGWSETLSIVELCRMNGVQMWVGGMIEFGVSKAHNLALASLPDISLPGDFSDSDHFWHEDVIEPAIHVKSGEIALRSENGIGYNIKF
ncbi:o-succinylbenzoate synthase [Planomicrobium sp. CPCC 101079]|uniref:o-succinylbenzoate synthase n=1 Tax=Planomicrobium sp. CPCC 101079 TaxID=2599618 RepID=UPI0011B64CE6|nr:o-succinylbenzoate synthase [Planomicrobium sp. CPCC 101079]TWT12518.1 o-succinylbenzoate synthase [Planomicrobium sp. CPCC 101079]